MFAPPGTALPKSAHASSMVIDVLLRSLQLGSSAEWPLSEKRVVLVPVGLTSKTSRSLAQPWEMFLILTLSPVISTPAPLTLIVEGNGLASPESGMEMAAAFATVLVESAPAGAAPRTLARTPASNAPASATAPVRRVTRCADPCDMNTPQVAPVPLNAGRASVAPDHGACKSSPRHRSALSFHVAIAELVGCRCCRRPYIPD